MNNIRDPGKAVWNTMQSTLTPMIAHPAQKMLHRFDLLLRMRFTLPIDLAEDEEWDMVMAGISVGFIVVPG